MAVDHLERTIHSGIELVAELNDLVEMHGPELIDDHLVRADALRKQIRRSALSIVLSAETNDEAVQRLSTIAEQASDPRPALGLKAVVQQVVSEEFSLTGIDG